MPIILCIETATAVCSVALIDAGKIITIRESDIKNAHSSVLNVFIEELFADTALTFKDLDAVTVSMGPGSYTGLRIGVSTAKGLCYALDKPLIALGTLHCMAAGFKQMHPNLPDNALLCPMIDARRMEVFTALYDYRVNQIYPVSAEIINDESFGDILKEHPVYFFGDGASKCIAALSHHQTANFTPSFTNSASHMAVLAYNKLMNKEFEDSAYFEPFYLKDFIAGKPRVKGLYE